MPLVWPQRPGRFCAPWCRFDVGSGCATNGCAVCAVGCWHRIDRKRQPRLRLIKPGFSCTCRASNASPTIWCGVLRPQGCGIWWSRWMCPFTAIASEMRAMGLCAPQAQPLSAIADALCHQRGSHALPSRACHVLRAGRRMQARVPQQGKLPICLPLRIPFTQTWRDLARLRELWPGKLIVAASCMKTMLAARWKWGRCRLGVKPRRQGAGQRTSGLDVLACDSSGFG